MKLSERLVALGHWESTASGASECIAQARVLEVNNEALTKRVAELEEAVTWRISMMDQWQAQSKRQGKEIAELEAEVSRLAWWEERSAELIPKEEYHELQEHIAKLQSQLAWTPVGKGLPTEPGRYQFIDDINFQHPDHGEFPHYWRKPAVSPSDSYHWFLHHGRWFGSPLDWCKGYTHWRKVELPVRPITLPEAK